ncbi:MAG: ribonuclease HII [Nanoarchaeota archaeon]|nr:ribonuclease HII [Nanoarchaeota archaeon]
MKLLGIDDAGRGPVLGPMILTGILIEESEEQFIKNLGAKDSKLLTPKRRNEIKNQITKFPHHIELSTPNEIDNHKNLNLLEAEKAAKIINTLTKNLKEKVKIIIDCPSTNIQSWTRDVEKILTVTYHLPPTTYHLICRHKADRDHPVVSAASIIAKEKREEEMLRLRTELNKDFGSGYPADPKTKKFIAENFNNEKYKHIIRFSWNTVKKLIKAKETRQQKLF